MKKICFLLLMCISTICGRGPRIPHDKNFVIVTASYNNEKWCEENLRSIFAQEYENWRLVYIDDCSTDNTVQLVKKTISDYNMWHKVTLIENKTRRGHLYNQYNAIMPCQNNDIIVIVDGDDFLAHNRVLNFLNETYKSNYVWMTHGNCIFVSTNRPRIGHAIPSKVLQENTIRYEFPFYLSHLRTFYAGLYKLIKLEDLQYDDKFFPMAVDVATMVPMAEMAGNHIKFIEDILYIYNDRNTTSFQNNIHAKNQLFYHNKIKEKQRYRPLSYLSFLQ